MANKENNSITVDGADDQSEQAKAKKPVAKKPDSAIIPNPMLKQDAPHDKMLQNPQDDKSYLKQHVTQAKAEPDKDAVKPMPSYLSDLRARAYEGAKGFTKEVGKEVAQTVTDPKKRADFVVGMVGPGEVGEGEAGLSDGVKAIKDMVEGQGLKYKGEVVKDSGVHMIEHPDHPGKTAAVTAPITPDTIKDHMTRKLKDFGVKTGVLEDIKPQSIHPDEVADMQKANPGRMVSADRVPAMNRTASADRNIQAGLRGERGDDASQIRETHRADLDKQAGPPNLSGLGNKSAPGFR